MRDPGDRGRGDRIDLHGFTRAEAEAVLRRFLEQAQQRGCLDVTVIHGRGTGILAEHVRKLLDQLPGLVANFGALPPREGWGVRIRLRSAPQPAPRRRGNDASSPSKIRDLLRDANRLDRDGPRPGGSAD